MFDFEEGKKNVAGCGVLDASAAASVSSATAHRRLISFVNIAARGGCLSQRQGDGALHQSEAFTT